MKSLLRLLISRPGIIAVNWIIIAFIVLVCLEAWELMHDALSNADEIEEIIDTVGVVLIAWGVALEERGTLMEVFGTYAGGVNPVEEHVDHECHVYGMAILLLGLFMEVAVELVKVPDTLVNTVGLESVLFGAGLFFMVVGGALLAYMTPVLRGAVVRHAA